MRSLEEIFAGTRVDPVTGCRVWLGALDSDGYGHVYWQGQTHRVHRVVWELLHGDPGALCVLHDCDNRLCCEPTHLFLGTRTDNDEDCVAKGRRPYGEQDGNRRLSETQVVEIKRLLAEGKQMQKQIAAAYGVSRAAISDIAQRKTWKHVSW